MSRASDEQLAAMAALAEAEQALDLARRRLAIAKGPTHVDGVRDPDYPCVEFRLGDPAGDCPTDGHYVCDECVHRATCDGCGLRPSRCECEPEDESEGM